MSLLYQDTALCLRHIESFTKIRRIPNKSPTCSTVEGVRTTGLAAGTFRNRLLTMRRHHKRPQNAVIHLRCIKMGGQIHSQLPRGRVSRNSIVCKAVTFPCHRPANGEVEARAFSDGALVLEQRQLVRELALGSRRCRATGSSASVRPCDVLSRVRRCLILGYTKHSGGTGRARMSCALASTRMSEERLRTHSLWMCIVGL
jgi:hypothetical protein